MTDKNNYTNYSLPVKKNEQEKESYRSEFEYSQSKMGKYKTRNRSNLCDKNLNIENFKNETCTISDFESSQNLCDKNLNIENFKNETCTISDFESSQNLCDKNLNINNFENTSDSKYQNNLYIKRLNADYSGAYINESDADNFTNISELNPDNFTYTRESDADNFTYTRESDTNNLKILKDFNLKIKNNQIDDLLNMVSNDFYSKIIKDEKSLCSNSNDSLFLYNLNDSESNHNGINEFIAEYGQSTDVKDTDRFSYYRKLSVTSFENNRPSTPVSFFNKTQGEKKYDDQKNNSFLCSYCENEFDLLKSLTNHILADHTF